MLRLKDLREDHDLLQKEIADYLNISQVTYSYYESGKRMIPFELLIKLAEYYHTSVDYILDRTNQKEPYPKAVDKVEI